MHPIGDALVSWLQQCPNLFWRKVEEAMEQSLGDRIPQLPPSTQFGRIIVNLSTDLAIVSPMMQLQLGLPPYWREPRIVIKEILPGRTTSRLKTTSE